MPSSYVRPDSVLKRLVDESLAHTSGLDVSSIGVSVEGGAVTLSGQVQSYPQVLLAQKAAFRVRGVNVLHVTIEVAGSSPAPTDLEIAIAARLALERAVNIPSLDLHVVVRRAAITLTGSVPWDFQREAATRTVAQLHGVRNVIDRIDVSPTIAPGEIHAGISAALSRNARLSERPIEVVVDGGMVRLSGSVHSWQEKHEAQGIAWSAPGVTGVDNQLRMAVSGDEALLV